MHVFAKYCKIIFLTRPVFFGSFIVLQPRIVVIEETEMSLGRWRIGLRRYGCI